MPITLTDAERVELAARRLEEEAAPLSAETCRERAMRGGPADGRERLMKLDCGLALLFTVSVDGRFMSLSIWPTATDEQAAALHEATEADLDPLFDLLGFDKSRPMLGEITTTPIPSFRIMQTHEGRLDTKH